MRELYREQFEDVNLLVGDTMTFNVKVDGVYKFSRTITPTAYTVLNEAAIFELENGELGFKTGYALVAGESNA